ncbi:hypothetical protein NDU88_006331 [Pleurodeles waltl]|uniref:Uncharacterized protein n=1 Tax=Pleurodeles waltl TaxID=8319 RepID=A0AAV7NRM1_PLEWA|nr:hypothetical protein NDU88_006331 [Pleurodeles waltl]
MRLTRHDLYHATQRLSRSPSPTRASPRLSSPVLRRLDAQARASSPSCAVPAGTPHRPAGLRTEAPAHQESPAPQVGHRAALAGPARCAQRRIIWDSGAES